MTLPRFSSESDPGPDFLGLLGELNRLPSWETIAIDPSKIMHGTTVVAIQTVDGVVMAGDRRATSGHLISHRTIEKVFPADEHSGVAIAGAAGPAMEMVRLFQLQIEHYEKVEGRPLSLEGKANQLSQMLRNNLPAALQGLGVVPIFAGFDEKLKKLFNSLKEINSKLWLIEDEKRMFEKNSDFSEKFIKVSRDIHFLNDERSKVKLEINSQTGSKIREIKKYTDY